ncbi:MAG: response regulator [Deltaproteobacteria bacterium]|nr:response regulator [Deltaproteobacteria bacterium]
MTEMYTLLTIEDEEQIRRSIRAFFEDMDCRVVEAGDGERGLELFRQKNPDVVLVDLRMPGMSGLEVIDVLSREAPEIPIVVLSGTGVVADAIDAIRRGAWDYIMKPIKDMAELEHVVKSVLERARLRDESRRYHISLEEEIRLRTKELRESEQQLQTKARELQVLNRLGREMGEVLSVETIVDRALDITFTALHPDLVLFFVREGNDLLLRGFLPEESDFSKEDVPIHRVGECLCGTAARDGSTVYSWDIHTDPRCTYEECKRAGFRSFAALPLKSEGEIIGVLGLASLTRRDFEVSASFLEALGHEMAIGVKNGLLFEKVKADAIELQTRLVQIRESQKEKEELMLQLHRAQKMEAIGTLAGGIAHDFNNILAPIVMGTEMALLNIPQDHKASRMLKQVLDAVARAKDLVNQILTFSRQGDLQKGPMQVAPVLKEAVKLSRAALPATIEIRQDIRTEGDTVLADPTQVHQVIVNLVTNAAHAMGSQGGILEIILDEEMLDESTAAGMDTSLTPGEFLKLMVRDTGHGMDHRILEKIFDPFFTTKRRGEGTGLGLATVSGIVRNWHGAVRVESQLGKGSLFTIYLPRLESRDKKKEKEVEPIPRGTERILFVDDEPMIAEMYADMLRFLGYEVECMTDPLETLNAFRTDSEGYDLVITDMTMPGMTGEELGREIMRIRPQTPVILCTGFTERMPEHKALQLGFRAFVMKPVVTQEIAQKVRQALDSKGSGQKAERS